MNGLSRLPMSTEQREALPLAFRMIFFKDLAEAERKSLGYHVERYGSKAVVSTAFEKPVSRI